VRRGGRAIALGKTALVDNTAALIRLAGREHRLGGRYADLTADLAPAPSARREAGRRGPRRPFSTAWARGGGCLGPSPPGERGPRDPTADRLVSTAGRLYRWRRELTGEALDPPG